MNKFEDAVYIIVVLVVVYALFGLVVSYAWNNSVRVAFPTTGSLGIWNALMLVLTTHILFGGLNSTINFAKNNN